MTNLFSVYHKVEELVVLLGETNSFGSFNRNSISTVSSFRMCGQGGLSHDATPPPAARAYS